MALNISRILHAGYYFEYENTRIVFDPIFENPFSRNCFAFPSVAFDTDQIQKLALDAVFISHFHDDHCSMESLNLLNKKTPIYIFCVHEDMLSMIRSLGFVRVFSLRLNTTIKIGSIQVTPYPALDVDVDSIFHIQAGDVNVLNVVDSWIDERTLKVLERSAPWDLVLWPFQTMRELEVLSPSRFKNQPVELPHEWLEQIKKLNPKVIVPSSCQFIHETWSWYNHAFFPISYQYFEKEIKRLQPGAQVLKLNPGVSVTMTRNGFQPASPLSWMSTPGTCEVDYEYRPNADVPTTSEIATKISAISEEDAERVYRYCTETLPVVYSQLYEDDQDYEIGYFKESRLWRLQLYDHLGQVRTFSYRIQGRRMVLADHRSVGVSWLTEAPCAKIFAALELGESLTSMYLRINDTEFDSSVEAEIKDSDVLDDPLVRCLFNRVFGAYQTAQLKKILNRD